MISQLDTMIGKFEDDKDVKCWSSFKQLETFVAGCQLSPQTTHLKTEVVINYLDQIWKLADNARGAGTDSIDVKTFDTVAGKIFANEVLRDASFEFKLQERILIIPNQDIDNYLGTVEPLRVLRLMARRVSEREPIGRHVERVLGS